MHWTFDDTPPKHVPQFIVSENLTTQHMDMLEASYIQLLKGSKIYVMNFNN